MNAVILGAAGDPVRSPREAHIECLARVRERMPGGQVRVLVVPAKRNYRFVVSLSTDERLSTIALMPRGSNFLLLRQNKVTKEKATPTFALIRDLKRKRRAVRNSLRSNNGPLHRRFHSKSRGRIHGGPFEPMFDRCAMRIAATQNRSFRLLELKLIYEMWTFHAWQPDCRLRQDKSSTNRLPHEQLQLQLGPRTDQRRFAKRIS